MTVATNTTTAPKTPTSRSVSAPTRCLAWHLHPALRKTYSHESLHNSKDSIRAYIITVHLISRHPTPKLTMASRGRPNIKHNTRLIGPGIEHILQDPLEPLRPHPFLTIDKNKVLSLRSLTPPLNPGTRFSLALRLDGEICTCTMADNVTLCRHGDVG